MTLVSHPPPAEPEGGQKRDDRRGQGDRLEDRSTQLSSSALTARTGQEASSDLPALLPSSRCRLASGGAGRSDEVGTGGLAALQPPPIRTSQTRRSGKGCPSLRARLRSASSGSGDVCTITSSEWRARRPRSRGVARRLRVWRATNEMTEARRQISSTDSPVVEPETSARLPGVNRFVGVHQVHVSGQHAAQGVSGTPLRRRATSAACGRTAGAAGAALDDVDTAGLVSSLSTSESQQPAAATAYDQLDDPHLPDVRPIMSMPFRMPAEVLVRGLKDIWPTADPDSPMQGPSRRRTPRLPWCRRQSAQRAAPFSTAGAAFRR